MIPGEPKLDRGKVQPLRFTWLRRAVLVLSLVSLALMAVCYWAKFDACAVVTLVPGWWWALPGIAMVGWAYWRSARRSGLLVGGLWIAFALLTADTPVSVLRAFVRSWPTASRSGETIRVVTLNCAGHMAEEIETLAPDIVLLQESPDRRQVEELAQRLFGEEAVVLWGPDTSVIARGKIVPGETPKALRGGFSADRIGSFVQARVRLSGDLEVHVVSLRLRPAPLRDDLWSPDCWKQHADHRRQRRKQLQAVLRELDGVEPNVPIICGGDFNAPPSDAVFNLLRPKLSDAFSDGGLGWGATLTSDWPIWRFDQVWHNEHLRAVAAVAIKTRHSDHRMVVCDLLVLPPDH
ncbi:MAG TPA: endonuclease/exonuclease/phosphatase family protein [Thermoguttaceae bacterium]|nr:endonuclease/exonuclease/phosphatase family protein [Thermoguttaceae bacterium]